jgi:hypothetical protein
MGGTRYDKLAANYFAFVQLASIRLWPSVDDVQRAAIAGIALGMSVADGA